MSSDVAPEWPLGPVRPACPPFDVSTLERRRGDCLGRLSDVLDFTGPILYGTAAWLAACRLTWVMRWLKTSDDEGAELDPVG